MTKDWRKQLQQCNMLRCHECGKLGHIRRVEYRHITQKPAKSDDYMVRVPIGRIVTCTLNQTFLATAVVLQTTFKFGMMKNGSTINGSSVIPFGSYRSPCQRVHQSTSSLTVEQQIKCAVKSIANIYERRRAKTNI